MDEAQSAVQDGRRADARALYEGALRAARAPEDGPRVAAALRAIALLYHADGDIAAALDTSEAAVAVAECLDDDGEVGHALNARAAVLWRAGELDEAERLYLRARGRALRAGDARLSATTAHNLGVIASVRGALGEARRHFELSLGEYRALGSTTDAGVALLNLGKLHTTERAWAAAEDAFAEAEQLLQGVANAQIAARLLLNRAELLVARGDHAGAHGLLEQAMRAGAADAGACGEAHKLSGVVARELGDGPGEEFHFAQAERIAVERHDQLLLAETLRERAAAYRREGRNRDALQALNRAHRIFAQLRARRELAELDGRIEGLAAEFEEVARRWGESIEAKDRYTQGHCVRVAELGCLLAARAGFKGHDLVWFRIGALLHDVGKLVIPAEVLNKPGKLTDEEWALVRSHPSAGVEMLAGIDFPWDVRPLVESHHERWDGTGYPHQLAAEAIPLTARVLAVADVYDALTTQRSYKPALSVQSALELMRRDVGRAFDPAVFALFEEIAAAGLLPGPAAGMGSREVADDPARDAAPAGLALADPQEPPDELTGLPLRRAFLAATARALRARRLVGAHAALLVIDVDHFKLVNDAFGHLQGDDVLRAVAAQLTAGVRPGDVVGRYAGDEFVALLRDATLEEACAVAERLRAAVAGTRCARRDVPGATVGVTLSIGVAEAPAHGDSFEELFAAADTALYGAKRRGRNAVTPAASSEAREHELQLDRFAGRSAERQQLDRLFASAAAGSPRLCAVVGEAGVGKSTLVRQIGAIARVHGGALVTAACLEADVRPPLGPWADVLAAVHALGLVAPRRWRELPRLVPALHDGFAVASDGSRYALLDEIVEYMRLATATRPLVLVLDDMQWADGSTWDALEALGARLDRERLLVCLTVRSEDLHGEAAERRRRLSRHPKYGEIALARLSRDEVGHWLDAVFGGRPATPALLDDLSGRAEGNPLFMVQLLRTMLDDGVVRLEGGQWCYQAPPNRALPVAVEDLLTRRLDRLDAAARPVLTMAAVLGREFETALLFAACDQGEDEVLDALDAGLAAAVLRPADTRGERFAFAHALLPDVLRRSANPLRLRRTHERVARVLAERRPEAVADIAFHYDRAANAVEAYRYAMRAGAHARTVYAHEEAVAYFELAARTASAPDDAARAAWHVALVEEARARYGEVEARCTDLLDGGGAGAAGLVLSARRLRERARFLRGDDPRAALARCEVLLADARAAGDTVEAVTVLTMLSQIHVRLGDSETAEQVASIGVTAAEDIAARTGNTRLLADAVTRLGVTVVYRRPEDAVSHFRRALDLFVANDDAIGQLRCHVNLGVAYERAENQPASEASLAEAQALGRVVNAPDMLGGASLNLGTSLLRVGAFDRAQTCFEEALRCFDAIQNAPLRLAALYNLAHLARERGDTAASVTLFEPAVALAGTLQQTDVHAGAEAGIALAELALGAQGAAERRLQGVEALLAEQLDTWFQGAELCIALRVRLAVARGALDEAAAEFHRGLTQAAARDSYVAAWLVAECGPALREAGLAALGTIVERHVLAARARGYLPLLRRLAAAGAAP